MRKFIYILLMIISVRLGTAGEYTNDFMRIGVGARALAMGGAYVAMANDGSAFYWNPAGMAGADRVSLYFDHVPMFGGLAQYNAANVTLGFYQQIAVGFSWIRLGVEDIPRYPALQGSRFDRLTRAAFRSSGEPLGYFANIEDAILASFSRTLYFDLTIGSGFADNKIPMELSFGLTGKYIQHKLDDKKGTGQGLDAGVLLRMVSDTRVRGESKTWLGFGLLARDLSRTSMVWNTESNHKDVAEMTMQGGLAFSHAIEKLATRTTISFDQEFGFYTEQHLGIEIAFFNLLALRGGYYDEHLSAGAGLHLGGFTIDYAFVTKDLANTNRISGSFRF